MDRLLTNTEMGDLINLDSEQKYRCSDHSITTTVDVRPIRDAQDAKTAALVRAEERKAMGEWLEQRCKRASPGAEVIVRIGATDIADLVRGEAPAGWPEKEG